MKEYKIHLEFGNPQQTEHFFKEVIVQMPEYKERNDIILEALRVVGTYPRTYKVLNISEV